MSCADTGSAVPENAGPVTEVAPPPTTGTMPWGGDLQGFARAEARCEDGDDAVRLVWHDQKQFAVCRTAGGIRYLRGWTTGWRDLGDDAPDRWIALRGDFFTDTENSVQFVADGAKVDIGPETVTIVWPKEPGSKFTYSSTVRTGAGWTRLD